MRASGSDLVLLWMKLWANPSLLHAAPVNPANDPHFLLVLKSQKCCSFLSYTERHGESLQSIRHSYWCPREHIGWHHCFPASWFLEIFCTLWYRNSVLILRASTSKKGHENMILYILIYDFQLPSELKNWKRRGLCWTEEVILKVGLKQ